MTEEKKTRQRLTMTAMYEAICDLHNAMLPPEKRQAQDPPAVTFTRKPGGPFIVGLFARTAEEPFSATDLIAEAEHPDGVEEAAAALLEKMRDRFEEHRKKLLGGLDSVLARHHGALRGARSKIREKRS